MKMIASTDKESIEVADKIFENSIFNTFLFSFIFPPLGYFVVRRYVGAFVSFLFYPGFLAYVFWGSGLLEERIFGSIFIDLAFLVIPAAIANPLAVVKARKTIKDLKKAEDEKKKARMALDEEEVKVLEAIRILKNPTIADIQIRTRIRHVRLEIILRQLEMKNIIQVELAEGEGIFLIYKAP